MACGRTMLNSTIVSSSGKLDIGPVKLTLMDELHMLMGTVVALPAVLIPPGTTVDMATVIKATTWAVREVMASFPILGCRIQQVKTGQAGGKPSFVLICDNSPSGPGANKGHANGKNAWGILLESINLAATDAQVASWALHNITSSVRPTIQDALPPYLPALDAKRMAQGKDPLARIQLSWLKNGAVLLGMTMSHVVADARTLEAVVTNLVRNARRFLSGKATDTLAPCMQHYDRSCLHAIKGLSPTDAHHKQFEWVGVMAEEGGLRKAVSAGLAAVKMVSEDVKTLGLGVVTKGLLTQAFHMTALDLHQLKAACQLVLHQSGMEMQLSQHDVACALMWLVCCQARNRPLPGQPVDEQFSRTTLGALMENHMFGLTIDMRANCGALVSNDHWGNASCSLHIRGNAVLPVPTITSTWPLPPINWPCAWAPGGPAHTTSAWLQGLSEKARKRSSDSELMHAGSMSKVKGGMPKPTGETLDDLLHLLAASAARVRLGVNIYRSIPDVGHLTLESFEDHAKCDGLGQVCTMAKYASRLDGFLTSWAAFSMQPPSWLLGHTSNNHPSKPTALPTSFPASTSPLVPSPPPSLAPATPPCATTTTNTTVLGSITGRTPASRDPSTSLTSASSCGFQPLEGLGHLPDPDAPLEVLQPIIHPLGPWSSIAIQGPKLTEGKRSALPRGAARTGADGLMVYMTLPAVCEKMVRENAVLAAFMPTSRWL